MGEFLILKTADEARAIIAAHELHATEPVRLEHADGRVVGVEVKAPEDLPAWPRATMDGYAVRAKDTFGAGDAVPAFLRVKGAVAMGETFAGSVGAGEAVAIATGGVVPDGADAVVMVEFTQTGNGDELEVHKGVAPGDNVVRPGDDFRRGDLLAAVGTRLDARHVAALAAVGVTEVMAYVRPRVGILSTGNEIVPPTDTPAVGKVRDVNQLALAARVRQAGADVVLGGIARDDADELAARTRVLLDQCDVVLLSGGSSIGTRDLTAGVFERLRAEVLFHGISVRPGKPTIFASVDGKPLIGLPGVPVSALVIFDAFIRPLIWRFGGEQAREEWPRRHRGRLTRRLASVAGREDWVRIRLNQDGRVEPLLGGSAALSTVLRADGYLRVPANVEGIAEGDEVEVYLHD